MRKGIIVSLFLLAVVQIINAQGSINVAATLSVGCPFYVNAGVQPTYPKIGDIPINYTVHTQGNCVISSLNGQISVDLGSSPVMSNAISLSGISSTPETFNTLLNTAPLSNGTYTVNVSLSSSGISNHSIKYFQLLNPANIVVTGVSSSPSVQQGSAYSITVSLKNTGQYASTGSTLYLSVNGPSDYANSYNIIGISPGQTINATISLDNITSLAGEYAITVYDQYLFDSLPYNSLTANDIYSVYLPRTSSAGGTSAGIISQIANPISQIQNFVLITSPFIISASSSNPSIAILRSENTGTIPEHVNLSIPYSYSKTVSISPSEGYVLPKQQFSSEMAISPNNTTAAGTYLIPINISVSSSTSEISTQEYMLLNIYKPSKNKIQVINFVSLANYTDFAKGIAQITNPTNRSLSNLTMQTLLPYALVSNASQISTSGIYGNVTKSNGFYVINWEIPQLLPDSSAFAYYTINKPSNPVLLDKVQNVVMQPQQSNVSILTRINTVIPTVYTNSTGVLQLEFLYTGISAQQVGISLSSAPGISISNSSQTLNVTPNQLISPTFNIKAYSLPGTFIINVYANIKNRSYSYEIPLLVLQNLSSTQPQPKATTPFAFQSSEKYTEYAEAATVLIILLLFIFLIKNKIARPRYVPERAERLVRLRMQIKRDNKSE